MSGFGRKGVTGTAPTSFGDAMARRNAMPAPVGAAALEPTPSSELAAFLAAERKRNAAAPEPGLSDIAIATPRAPRRASGGSEKSMIVAYVLWWFGAVFAAHRFYLGAYGSASAMAGLFWGGLILGGFMSHQSTVSVGGYFMPPIWAAMILVWMLWVFVDIFLIPGLVRATREPDRAAVFA